MISNRQWRQEDHFVGGPATKNGLHHCPAKAALSILCFHPFWQCRESPSDILISQELPIPFSSFLAKLGLHAGHFVWDTHDWRCFCFYWIYTFFENIPQSLYGELAVEASHAGESEIATCVVLLKLTVPPFFLKYIEVQNEKWPSRLCSFMKYFVRFILPLFWSKWPTLIRRSPLPSSQGK